MMTPPGPTMLEHDDSSRREDGSQSQRLEKRTRFDSGSISFRSLTLSFGTVAQAVAASATDPTIAVPRNVTEVGVDISDGGHSQAQAVIREATRADVVVVDLEDGRAWWDSRLLLLRAGAEQHGRPAAVVLVATLHRRHRQFVGWARPSSIVKCLIQADRNLA